MNFSAICRTCLNKNNLNPIFINEDKHDRYSSAIFLCTGIQVELNDGLPQNICTECMIQLNNILKFRKQCKVVETQLLKIKTEIESGTDSIITNEAHSLNITNNISSTKTKDLLITLNKSGQQRYSNVTKIKTEFYNNINIKSEPLEKDIDEDKPLKLFIHKNTESVSVQKDSENDLTYNDNATEHTNSEFYDEETSLYKTEKDLKAEKNAQNIDTTCEDITNTEQFKTVILSQVPKKNSKKKTELDFNDIDKETDITDSLTDSILAEESKNGTEIPYEVVSETVTYKTMRVVCKFCQKELSIRSIDSHMARRHPGADERKVKCELCDRYVLKEKLNRHKIMMHGNIGVKCGYCKLEFNSQEVLVDHVKTCTAKKRKRPVQESGRVMAECDICKMKMQKASLRMHKAVKHAGLRPVCEHCGRSFGNKFRLNEHYRAKHGYEKFQCSYCEFRSAGIMGMRNHERRHRGEKPFVCETCGAKFHAAYLLTQHKHSHRTDKIVKCDLCPASFKANNSLHMHKLTCHSKSLYRCTICSRSYKCRYYAVKHARIAHSATGTPPVVKMTC